ncbi:Cation/H(+) antiporter 11 [Rhynchospora pubera]|uniref:Cation/H(+) antiporter 11 n=1 Tax=Rhynchospora pubera TaxID=906938 RepID=A0AAV8E264_9POAL|nr:Cation/H(+) antiporter 11 [Rhynchospora pubera]
MGGGSVLRPVVRPIVRPSGVRTRGTRRSSASSSSSSSSPASASFVPGVRSQFTGEPARQVFGPAPSEPEAEAALTALVQVFTQMSYPGTARDSQPIRVEQGNLQGTAVSSNQVRPEVHAGNSTRSSGLRLSASTSNGLDKIRNSLDLLNWNPSIQKVVISLSTDKAVWDAIMKNEAVQELHKYLIQAGRNEPLAFVGQDDFLPGILRWIIDTSKTKIVELINQLSDLIGALFRSRGPDEATEIVNDVIKSAFMLTVMVLIVVVVSRLQAESNP